MFRLVAVRCKKTRSAHRTSIFEIGLGWLKSGKFESQLTMLPHQYRRRELKRCVVTGTDAGRTRDRAAGSPLALGFQARRLCRRTRTRLIDEGRNGQVTAPRLLSLASPNPIAALLFRLAEHSLPATTIPGPWTSSGRDRRIDWLCVTRCSPSQHSHHAGCPTI